MIKTVWKFEIVPNEIIQIGMPKGAEVLSVDTQFDQPCLWALVVPKREVEIRKFRMAGTGHKITDNGNLKFIGTFQMLGGQLIFHLFEIL